MANNSNKNLDFLQSEEWRKFQEAAGHRTFFVENEGFSASIIEHKLPIVGNYFYIPRGPIINCHSELDSESKNKLDFGSEAGMTNLINLAKKENAGWIRFDPVNEEILDLIKKNINHEIQKAPHDMQPKEIFVIDIAKTEKELLAEMKPKTRYNINLARKKSIKVFQTKEKKYVEEFLRLVRVTENRKGIKFHPANYYQKMLEAIPENILKLYVAEYNGKIIAANLIVFYNGTTIYLHGATDDKYRNVMAPYLLQWQAVLDAKNAKYNFYDFGGVKIQESGNNSWQGITKFKLGFSSNTQPIEFPGSYDIIINPSKYYLYKIIQRIKKCTS